MKKLIGWAVVIIVVAVAVFSALVLVFMGLREQELALRPLPTLENLDEVADGMTALVAERVAQAEQAERAAEPDGGEEEAAAPLPVRLEQVPSPEALTEQFISPGADQPVVARGCKTIEAVLRTVGAADTARDWAWETGRHLMWAGDWDAARGYLHELLDEPHASPRYRDACGRLAWLEEDPHKAARFLEMSCDDTWLKFKLATGSKDMARVHSGLLERHLSNAVELTRATGSDALADHYLERLRLLNPETARGFDVDSETEERQ